MTLTNQVALATTLLTLNTNTPTATPPIDLNITGINPNSITLTSTALSNTNSPGTYSVTYTNVADLATAIDASRPTLAPLRNIVRGKDLTGTNAPALRTAMTEHGVTERDANHTLASLVELVPGGAGVSRRQASGDHIGARYTLAGYEDVASRPNSPFPVSYAGFKASVDAGSSIANGFSVMPSDAEKVRKEMDRLGMKDLPAEQFQSTVTFPLLSAVDELQNKRLVTLSNLLVHTDIKLGDASKVADALSSTNFSHLTGAEKGPLNVALYGGQTYYLNALALRGVDQKANPVDVANTFSLSIPVDAGGNTNLTYLETEAKTAAGIHAKEVAKVLNGQGSAFDLDREGKKLIAENTRLGTEFAVEDAKIKEAIRLAGLPKTNAVIVTTNTGSQTTLTSTVATGYDPAPLLNEIKEALVTKQLEKPYKNPKKPQNGREELTSQEKELAALKVGTLHPELTIDTLRNLKISDNTQRHQITIAVVGARLSAQHGGDWEKTKKDFQAFKFVDDNLTGAIQGGYSDLKPKEAARFREMGYTADEQYQFRRLSRFQSGGSVDNADQTARNLMLGGVGDGLVNVVTGGIIPNGNTTTNGPATPTGPVDTIVNGAKSITDKAKAVGSIFGWGK